jgi:prepilin-type N-terminal cleavage/methylation domain-containing protein
MELKHRVPAFLAPRAGFSLIEVLLVVAILGILIGLMLPSLQTVREGARRVHCANSLRQIGIAMRLSADFRRGLFPDASKTGHFSYRMAPGLRTPNDPDALPEVFGLEAVYVKEGVLTAAEQRLIEGHGAGNGKGAELLKQLRSHLVLAGRPLLEQLVGEAAGASPVTLHHDISPVTGEEVIVITLATPPPCRDRRRR